MAPSEQSEAKPSVSIVILAYNEARNLPASVGAVLGAIKGKFAAYEVIIVNDGSSDDTADIAGEMAARNPQIRVVHNPGNRGCGYTFFHGVEEARYEHVWLLPGDCEIPAESIAAIADSVGRADMVIPYVLNFGIRPLGRRVVSWGYTALVNVLFLKNIPYYNGPCVMRTEQVRTVPRVYSRGFAFMAPILLRLIRRKQSYELVGIMLQTRGYGKPSIGSLFNIFSALRTMAKLFWDLNVAGWFGRKP